MNCQGFAIQCSVLVFVVAVELLLTSPARVAGEIPCRALSPEQVLTEIEEAFRRGGGPNPALRYNPPPELRGTLPTGSTLPPLTRADVFLFEDSEGVLADPTTDQSQRFDLYFAAINALLAQHGDRFDFVNILTSYDVMPAQPPFGHLNVANNVVGIGLPIVDSRPLLGISSNRVLGLNLFYKVDQGLFGLNSIASRKIICHEHGHQWLVHIPELLDGRQLRSASEPICGITPSHWNRRVDQQGSAMSPDLDWVGTAPAEFESVSNEFHRDVTNGFFSFPDLYLMGYVTATEADAGASELRFMDDDCGSPYNGTISEFTVADIVATAGVRVPPQATSQKDYRSAWILMHLPGEIPTIAQVDIALTVMKQLTLDWEMITLSRGTMDCGIPRDCNSNGIHDTCDVDCGPPDGPCDVPGCGLSGDCDGDGSPDFCDPDCNANAVSDRCDIVEGTSADCNASLVPDECEIANGSAHDCNGNSVLDACEFLVDCNCNGIQDTIDLLTGTSLDCNGNLLPDECDIADGLGTDCDANVVPDDCQLATGISTDCNGNEFPDVCDFDADPDADCDSDGISDLCQLVGGSVSDCNRNGAPDLCDLESGDSTDCDSNGVPDECDPDCNRNEIADACDIAQGTSKDSDANGIPDGCLVFVDAGAQGGGTGTSWADAFTDLQDALALAAEPGGIVREVWVASATYRPDGGTGDRSLSFDFVDGLKLFGGFAGDESSRDERDPAANRTLLSGDLLMDDVGGSETLTNDDNSIHVVTAINAGPESTLDGFEIRGGNANGFCCFDDRGAGLFISGGAPTIRDCDFAGHEAISAPAVHLEAAAAPRFIDCRFFNNTATISGGAMFITQASAPRLTGCEFIHNNAGVVSGAVHIKEDSLPVFVNCVIRGSHAQFSGAVAVASGAAPSFIHCTLSGNSAESGSGGIDINSTGVVTLSNSILWENSLAGVTNQATQLAGAGVVINYSTIQGWTGELGGAGNDGLDPRFDDVDLRLNPFSPCEDAGSNAIHPRDTDDVDGDDNVAELLPFDLDHGRRRVDVSVDKGAFEIPAKCLSGCGDVNGDGLVNLTDFASFALCFGGDPLGFQTCACADLNKDAVVDLVDFATFSIVFGVPAGAVAPDCF